MFSCVFHRTRPNIQIIKIISHHEVYEYANTIKKHHRDLWIKYASDIKENKYPIVEGGIFRSEIFNEIIHNSIGRYEFIGQVYTHWSMACKYVKSKKYIDYDYIFPV